MLDLAIVALILCFIIGLISSALMLAALYLYQLARQSASFNTPDTDDAIVDAVNACSTSVEALEYKAKPASSSVPKQIQVSRATQGGDGDTIDREAKFDEDGSTATTSYSSCEVCSQARSQRQQQQHQQQQQQLVFSSWTEEAATGSAGCKAVYTCQVCGSCCAGDTQKAAKTYRPLDANSIDAELSVDNASIRLRRCRTGVGAYFFHRNAYDDDHENGAALPQAVSAVSSTVTLPAETDCLYNLRFCTTNGEAHSGSLTQCSDCRLVLCFELTKLSTSSSSSSSETVLFVNRLRHKRPERQCRVEEIDSWLVAILTDSIANEATIAYSGMAKKFVQIARQADCLLVLQLCLQGQQTQCLVPDTAVPDWDDPLAHGDLELASPLSSEQQHRKQQQQKQRQIRRKRRQVLRRSLGDEEATAAAAPAPAAVCAKNQNCEQDREACDGVESECSQSAGNSVQGDTKSSLTGGQSPLSMGSMRRAVRWPITQMESLMETSSSSTTHSAVTNPPTKRSGGDFTIRLEDDFQQTVALEESSAAGPQQTVQAEQPALID